MPDYGHRTVGPFRSFKPGSLYSCARTYQTGYISLSTNLMQRVISTLRTVSRLSVTTKTFQKARSSPIHPEIRVAKYCSVTKGRMEYCTVERGCLNDLDYRMFIQSKQILSINHKQNLKYLCELKFA